MPEVSDEVETILEDLGHEGGPHPLYAYVRGVAPLEALTWEDLAYPLRLEDERLALESQAENHTIYSRWVSGDWIQTVIEVDGIRGATINRDRIGRLYDHWMDYGVRPVLQENTPFREVDR